VRSNLKRRARSHFWMSELSVASHGHWIAARNA